MVLGEFVGCFDCFDLTCGLLGVCGDIDLLVWAVYFVSLVSLILIRMMIWCLHGWYFCLCWLRVVCLCVLVWVCGLLFLLFGFLCRTAGICFVDCFGVGLHLCFI